MILSASLSLGCAPTPSALRVLRPRTTPRRPALEGCSSGRVGISRGDLPGHERGYINFPPVIRPIRRGVRRGQVVINGAAMHIRFYAIGLMTFVPSDGSTTQGMPRFYAASLCYPGYLEPQSGVSEVFSHIVVGLRRIWNCSGGVCRTALVYWNCTRCCQVVRCVLPPLRQAGYCGQE
ncbi:hypothetical protein BJ322DRAFT_405 [Thelephora terrestris]|uniref:Uncharacterized protein n=1 Tax=Thelephora terrestris TaxID=56493 RepID=A0A9P6HNP1_9AGAM|nr:hypothetical protein BJ322DRAFT_405 [Thelephora terrestris]